MVIEDARDADGVVRIRELQHRQDRAALLSLLWRGVIASAPR
jgi:hypothetical protein